MRTTRAVYCISAVMLLVGAAGAADDILIADFEGGDYGDWKVEGDCFGDAPVEGTLPRQRDVSGFAGKRLVNTYRKGDGTTGTLTSPAFEIKRKYITFLIGGGAHKGTALQLLVDGTVVASRSGANDELLMPALFDVEKYKGKKVRLRIVDKVKVGWGHVNVDHILQSDQKPKVPKRPGRMEKEFTVDSRYLVMPIKNGKGKKGRIQVYIDGEEVRRYGITIAPNAEQTDWYAFFTIEQYAGKKARVVATATEEGFALVRQSDTIPGEEHFYTEPYRPQFHFTQKVGWNNDPNGMVYHDGKWHLFFQHNPVALPWGNMTWGHATSPDLVHWTQHRNKLFPGTMATGACFSGGATVDHNNSSGWGKNTLVAYFTDTGCGEAIAYSTDGGETFTCYEDNPVVRHKGRDPKVIWYAYKDKDAPLNETAREMGGHWVMVVYDEHEEFKRNAAFYTSNDMKNWTEQSHLPNYFECTELFELPVDGDKKNMRWCVFAADAKYQVGRFDGTVFTPEHDDKRRVHYGPYYASQTFDKSPDGRKIQIGWLRIGAPGPYNQHFSFPHRLTLHKTEDGIRMFAKPVKEIETLRLKSHTAEAQDLGEGRPVSLPVKTDLLDVRLTVGVAGAETIELHAAGMNIRYDVKAKKLNGADLAPVEGRIKIQALVDRSVMEIAGNDGRVFISAKGPGKIVESPTVSVIAGGGTAKLVAFEAHELTSIWQKQKHTAISNTQPSRP